MSTGVHLQRDVKIWHVGTVLTEGLQHRCFRSTGTPKKKILKVVAQRISRY